jgi:hypothetical protein
MADGAVIDSANRVVLVGAHALEGRAAGNYCSIVQPDRVAVDVGVDGEGVFRVNGNKSATVTVALMPSSKSNDVLSAIMAAGLPVPLSVIAQGERSKFVAPRAMLTKVADLIWSDGTEVRSWTFVCTSGQLFVGGMPPGTLNSDVGTAPA